MTANSIYNEQQMTTRNRLLIAKIRESIPHHLSLRDYLVDKLRTSKESAYRRIRGDVPFSFDEVMDISLDLGFSLDELSGQNLDNEVFPGEKRSFHVQNKFMEMLREYYTCIETIFQAKEHQVWMSARRLNLFFLLGYDTLFRFFYYQWMQRSSPLLSGQAFSRVEIPVEMEVLRAKIRTKLRQTGSLFLILDRHLFSSFVREVDYYYQQKLLSETEVLRLRRELTVLLKQMERRMKQVAGGNSCQFYVSMLEVDNNSIYAGYNDCHLSLYWLCPLKTLIVRNPGGSIHQRWMESLKRQSALISGSGEILQMKFIEAQHEAIRSISIASQDVFFRMA
jgi:hypothetical protein